MSLLLTLNKLHTFFSCIFVDFEQVNVCWKPISCLLCNRFQYFYVVLHNTGKYWKKWKHVTKWVNKYRLTRVISTLSWRRSLSYRNQSIDLLTKSIDWFLYNNNFRHERIKLYLGKKEQASTHIHVISLEL